MNTGEVIALIKAFGGGGGGSSGSGVLVVHETVSGGTHTLDKTWQEIHDADFAVVVSDIPPIKSIQPIVSIGAGINDIPYIATVYNYDKASATPYTTPSANGYPSYTE